MRKYWRPDADFEWSWIETSLSLSVKIFSVRVVALERIPARRWISRDCPADWPRGLGSFERHLYWFRSWEFKEVNWRPRKDSHVTINSIGLRHLPTIPGGSRDVTSIPEGYPGDSGESCRPAIRLLFGLSAMVATFLTNESVSSPPGLQSDALNSGIAGLRRLRRLICIQPSHLHSLVSFACINRSSGWSTGRHQQ